MIGRMRPTICISILGLFLTAGITRGEQTCQTRCEDETCPECPEKKVCLEDEIDCGPKPKSALDHCEADRVCVAKSCQCPTTDNTGEDCPVVCTTECGDDKLLCPGSKDSKGCQQPDQCAGRGTDSEGDLCPGVCPVSCRGNEVLCPMPADSKNCEIRPMCKAKGTDTAGNDCPGVCPISCSADEIVCAGKVSANGCQEADTCVKKGTDNDGNVCPGFCPVECSENELLCEGQLLANGCRAADVCYPKAKDANGEFCPDNSASHNCPTTCKPEEDLCPGREGSLGCKGEDQCKEKKKDLDGNSCPSTSVCPSNCKVNEIACASGMDINGCKNPDLCVPRDRDNNGDLCPVNCPKTCAEDQMSCPGKTSSEGCKEEDTCIDRGHKTKGNDLEGFCPGYCPVDCKPGVIKCPIQHDCDGCKTEEACRPAAKDINGEDCDLESASHLCPKVCDEDEALCPGHNTLLGCKTAPSCVKRTVGADETYCPSRSVCQTQCHEEHNEMRCPGGMDHNGCKNADVCISRGKDHDNNICSVSCPPICDQENQVLCIGGTKSNGCKDDDVCVAKIIGNDGAQCRPACPISCPADNEHVSGGTDENGCPRGDFCSAPKSFGDWTNEGNCVPSGDLPDCGPGTQLQKRTCNDGTIDKCTEADKQRTVTCAVAGSELPICGIFYKCESKGCKWSDHKDTDWGYYTENDGDCSACHDRCSKDEQCGGVECGKGYCSFWKVGKCVTPEERKLDFDGSLLTCHKDNFLDPCTNGDVQLKDDGTPLIYWAGTWSPICGHYFWDNQYGATKFCQQMGYDSGEQTIVRSTYANDAFIIGRCKQYDFWESCSDSCNDYKAGNGCKDCSAGEEVSITVKCQSESGSALASSCKVGTYTSGCTGGDSCCTEENRCAEQEGDCDNDAQCLDGLKCGTDNCATKIGLDWDDADDCCYKPE